MKAMLLAAGEGTRLRPHTLKKPKPAIPFLNVPLGYYSFPYLRPARVESLVINTYHLPDEIMKIYMSQTWFSTQFTEEKGMVLGSGGGLWNARSHFENEEDFFLLNADEVIISQSANLFLDMKTHHQQENALSTLMVMEYPDVGTKFGGVWVDARNKVIGFGKQKPANAVRGYHYIGVQILNKEIFRFIPEKAESNILYDALTAAIAKNRKVQIHKVECDWFETGNAIDYLHATEIVLRNIATQHPQYLRTSDFLKEMSPSSQFTQKDGSLLWLDETATIEDVKFNNMAVVGAHTILKGCQIENAVIGEGLSLTNEIIANALRI